MVEFVKQSMNDVWASAGDVVMPDSSKIQEGWLVEIPPRQYWNWMQNRTDTNLGYIFQRGMPEWDTEVEYINNKSFVIYNGLSYKCIQTHTNQNPSTATAYWVRAFNTWSPVGEAVSTLTMAADQYIYFTGPNTAVAGTITPFGRSILDDVDGASVVSTIGAQPLDATLTALAGVATASNKLIYFTGTDTAVATDLTAFGRSLIDDADAAAARTTLSVYSTSQVDTALAGKQPLDATLTSMAGVATAADTMLYFTGTDVAASTPITAFARTLLDDGTQAAARATLGTVAKSGDTFTGDVSFPSINGGALAGTKNKLINGDFRIWQRGTSLFAPAGAFTYIADRWLVGANGATIVAGQSYLSAGNYAIKLDGAPGNTYSAVAQRIEAYNIEADIGKPYTLQFQFFSPQARSVFVQLQTANSRDNFNGLTQFASVIVPVPANTLQKITLSAVLPATCANGVQVVIEPGALLSGDIAYIGTVQFEPGNVASTPEFRLQSEEIVNCQRYYQQLYASIRGFTPSAGLNQSAPLPFQVCMRVIPTFTITASAEGFGNVANPGMVVYSNNVFGARYEVQTTGAGEFYSLQHRILASAEL